MDKIKGISGGKDIEIIDWRTYELRWMTMVEEKLNELINGYNELKKKLSAMERVNGKNR